MSDSDGNSGRERRAFTRILFDADARISQEGKSWDVELIDISMRGILINSPPAWDIDDSQPLFVNIYLSEETLIRMEVLSAHQENGRTGLSCVNMDLDSMIHLRRLVELNTGDESLLERELSALG